MSANKNRPSSREVIEIIEGSSNLSELEFDNISFWPALRLKLFSRFVITTVSSKNSNSYTDRLRLFFSGVKQLAKLYLFPFAIRQSKLLFITKSAYRAKVNEIWFERFIDSIAELTHLKPDDYKVLEGTVDLNYNEPFFTKGKVEKFQGLYWLVSLFSSFFLPTKNFSNEYLLKQIVKVLNDNGVDIDDRAIQLFRVSAKRISTLSIVLERYLKIVNPSKVYSICYYEEYSMALLIAAKRLKIPYYDIQHGIQGPEHFAYSNFKNIPIGGYPTLPDYFLCWDENSAENINVWGKPFHQAIVIGNPWIMFHKRNLQRIKDVKKDIVLFTAQPYEEPLSQLVLSVLKALSHTFKIVIRLHPRMMEDALKLEKIILSNDIPLNIDLVEASECPLPELLIRTVLHATISSSVVLEAAEYNVGSLVFDEIGCKRFEHVNNVKVKLFSVTENLEDIVTKIVSNDGMITDVDDDDEKKIEVIKHVMA